MRKEKDYMAFAEFDLQLKGWPCFCILNIIRTYDSRFFLYRTTFPSQGIDILSEVLTLMFILHNLLLLKILSYFL